jgi:hypothetical protein
MVGHFTLQVSHFVVPQNTKRHRMIDKMCEVVAGTLGAYSALHPNGRSNFVVMHGLYQLAKLTREDSKQ